MEFIFTKGLDLIVHILTKTLQTVFTVEYLAVCLIVAIFVTFYVVHFNERYSQTTQK